MIHCAGGNSHCGPGAYYTTPSDQGCVKCNIPNCIFKTLYWIISNQISLGMICSEDDKCTGCNYGYYYKIENGLTLA
jgi:hypothetical protein